VNKEFIPYEQTLALKELGFDEPCVAFYYGQLNRLEIGFNWTNEDCKNSLLEEIVSAPLYQQAFRWFREKYDLHPSFTRYKSSSINKEPNIFTHLYEIQVIDENVDKTINVGDFNSIEEAEFECLKKLIEIIKNK